MSVCRECGKPLSPKEIHYYESRCEQCERDWCDEIEAWRHGEHNPKLDELYSCPQVQTH